MNFFNSIFSEDPQSSEEPHSPQSDHVDQELEESSSPNPNPNPNPDHVPTPLWNFGNLIKTIATKSESVIGNYKRDIGEFGSELLKETAVIRDVATRAVKDFPDSIDVGAAVAQESLETVGQAIDNLGSSVWKGTTQIIARGKDLHLFHDDDGDDGEANESGENRDLRAQLSEMSLGMGTYSRFDVRMRETQCDSSTYREDPEDLDDYSEWKLGFVLDDYAQEIEKLMGGNRVVERMYLELVPVTVHREVFWCRYFYKVLKLKQAEEARVRIVNRAISGDDEEDLSWDVDDEDGEDNGRTADLRESNLEEGNEETGAGEPSSSSGDQTRERMEQNRVSNATSETNPDEAVIPEEKVDSGESCKDSDLSIVSTQPSLPEEEELGWDEIEDLGSDGVENKPVAATISNASDLRKRLSTAEDEEDLSWDIEDDD